MDRNTTLGLDLGTTSIGWSLIDPRNHQIIASGVRIFPEGMDRTKGEKSLNQDRREARGLRRQGYRRVRRKLKLQHILQDEGLLPKDEAELRQLCDGESPYQLRKNALDIELSLFELGRALHHLGQRRGYQSNRKTGEEKDGKVAEGITSIQQAMQDGELRTLGEYFANLEMNGQKIRGVYTSRAMFKAEFDAIWEAQHVYHPEQLNVAARKRIHEAIFYQRPLKIQKHLIGMCEFEPKRKRAMAATLVAQEFRLWQSINHLKILYADGLERWLTDEERLALHNLLCTRAAASWSAIRKHLNKTCGSNISEFDRFNLERVRKSGIKGNQTAAIVSKAISAKSWKALGAKAQEQLVFDLLNIADEDALRRRLRRHWGLPADTAATLMKKALELPKGVLHMSHKAARAITRELSLCSTPDNRGITYDKACELAGYNHSQPKQETSKVQALPLPTLNLRNPMVERCLYQVRRVVNGVIREYGLPETIRIEMARDLKNNAKQRDNIDKINKANQKFNEAARKHLIDEGIPNPRRSDIIKYKLWEECGKVCPFSGKSIGFYQLFGDSPEFEVEHIIPYTRCMDDSFMNKTLCHRSLNQQKGNQTPFEAFGSSDAYADILQRAKKLPYKKFKRFSAAAMDEVGDFVSQQLNESRYIAVQTRDYLQQLDCKVEGIKGGRITAQLRHAWGLNNILSDTGEKTRKDHRHHAVDALVVALTTRKTVQDITRHVNNERAIATGEVRIVDYPCPFKDIRKKAEQAIGDIVVSHKVSRKISGALHDETIYGLSNVLDKDGLPYAVIRKPIKTIETDKHIDAIRDEGIKALAKQHLTKSKGFKDAFANPDNPLLLANKNGDAIPVNTVRMLVARSVRPVGKPYRDNQNKQKYVWTRGNHHAEIYEYTDKKGNIKWGAEIVPIIEALARQRTPGQSVVQRNHGEGKRFIMALHANDMVELTHKGETLIGRVQKMDINKNIVFRRHDDADGANWKLQIKLKPDSFRETKPRLISINAIGQIKYHE